MNDKKRTDHEYQAFLNTLADKLSLMKKMAYDLVRNSLIAYIENDPVAAAKLADVDKEIDNLELEIDALCEKILARRQPVASDLRFIISTLKQVADIERIGDLGENIAKRQAEMPKDRSITLPDSFEEMKDTLISMMEKESGLYSDGDREKFESLVNLDKKIDVFYVEIFREIIKQITHDLECTFEAMNLQSVIKTIERVGDHLTNLAEQDLYLHRGKTLKHRVLHENMSLKDMRGILFLCVQNSARSQIAEGLAKRLLPDHLKVWSAGSDPADEINPYAIQSMREIGINISKQKPKKISSIPVDEINIVINLCGEELCVDLPDIKKTEAWMLPDPEKFTGSKEEIQNQVNHIRDEIKYRIENLYKDLTKFKD